MIELPDEIWDYIKEFTLDWKLTHKQKMKHIFETEKVDKYGHIEKWGRSIYRRWTYFPPWPNTNDIILAEYVDNERLPYAPPANLPLTSICWNPKGTGGYWCGYGWTRAEQLSYNSHYTQPRI